MSEPIEPKPERHGEATEAGLSAGVVSAMGLGAMIDHWSFSPDRKSVV